MAQTLLTHEKIIENLIGEFNPSEHPELYRAGFHYVADLIPVSSELWQSDNLKGITIPTSGRLVRGGNNTEDTSVDLGPGRHLKIISVWRMYEGIWYECKEIPWTEFRSGKNPNSLYYHGNSTHNPTYSTSDGGRVYMSPAPTGNSAEFTGEPPLGVQAYMKFWVYEADDFFGVSESGDTFDSYDVTGDLHGFPRDAQLAAVIKSSMNILQAKMGESVHEDEDPELFQIQQAQFTQLGQFFESELSRLNIQAKKIGIEEE